MNTHPSMGRHNDHFPLDTKTEWDYEQSLYGVSAAALKAERTGEEADRQIYRIAQAAAIRLLLLLEARHDLPPENMYRQYFRNTMHEIRMSRKTKTGNTQE